MPGPELCELVWRKSSRSGPTGDNCVELATINGLIGVRDSKNPTAPALFFEPQTWARFVRQVKAGG